jgi:hypothetical protein
MSDAAGRFALTTAAAAAAAAKHGVNGWFDAAHHPWPSAQTMPREVHRCCHEQCSVVINRITEGPYAHLLCHACHSPTTPTIDQSIAPCIRCCRCAVIPDVEVEHEVDEQQLGLRLARNHVRQHGARHGDIARACACHPPLCCTTRLENSLSQYTC